MSKLSCTQRRLRNNNGRPADERFELHQPDSLSDTRSRRISARRRDDSVHGRVAVAWFCGAADHSARRRTADRRADGGRVGSAPGLSAAEVERQVTRPLEKLLYQIDGVEYVYSMSRPEAPSLLCGSMSARIVKTRWSSSTTSSIRNIDEIPPVVTSWVVKPVEIDDVPIVIATLWTDRTDLYGDHELRRMAEELQQELQAMPQTNRVWVTGGRPRRIRVELDAKRLAARATSPAQVAAALRASNVNQRVGSFEQQDAVFFVDAGRFLQDVTELGSLVVSVTDDRPVYLKDVAQIIDGPAEVETYSWIGFGPAALDENSEIAPGGLSADRFFPAVHLAIAKKKGSNAVGIARQVESRLAELSRVNLPDGVHYQITRDYGETANDKVNELVEGLIVAVLTVIGLIGLVIGWRAALVVAMAIPVCYSLTLFVNLLCGYTINRVTMFALILALGLLVDDPITDVENIARYFSMRVLPPRQAVLRAIQEVRPGVDPVYAGDHRQLFAAAFYHGHDGALHGTVGAECSVDRHASRRSWPFCLLPGWPWWP